MEVNAISCQPLGPHIQKTQNIGCQPLLRKSMSISFGSNQLQSDVFVNNAKNESSFGDKFVANAEKISDKAKFMDNLSIAKALLGLNK